MNRKPGFPTSTCSIKLPDGNVPHDENSDSGDSDTSYKKRQQLITFGHNQWGFENWSWSVTKQDLDYVDYTNGKFTAGVVAFVSVTIKSLNIHREDVGYATSVATQKGLAIHNARKSSVTNALRETFLSFGGIIATLLLEQIELQKNENQSDDGQKINMVTISDKNLNILNDKTSAISNNLGDPKNIASHNQNGQQNFPLRKDSSDSSSSIDGHQNKTETRSPLKLSSNNIPHPTSSGFTEKSYQNSNCNGRMKPTAADIMNNPVNQTGGKPVHFTANHNPMKMPPPPVMPSVGLGPPPLRPPAPLPTSNVCLLDNADIMMLTDEEARAERKRRQRQKQEEFRRTMQNSSKTSPG